VADIISIDKKLDLVKDKRAALIRRRKVLAVQKVFQCTHCALRVEMREMRHPNRAKSRSRRKASPKSKGPI
jgi:hypothetical protein